MWPSRVATLALLAAGIVHLLPLTGVLGAPRLAALYGVAIDDPSLLVLMRHRAVLFGVLGAFMLHAAWSPPLQLWALGAAFASTASFVWIAASSAPLSPALRTVMWIDIALAALLLGALALRVTARRG
jgi:hypothetical protein